MYLSHRGRMEKGRSHLSEERNRRLLEIKLKLTHKRTANSKGQGLNLFISFFSAPRKALCQHFTK